MIKLIVQISTSISDNKMKIFDSIDEYNAYSDMWLQNIDQKITVNSFRKVLKLFKNNNFRNL